MGRSVARVLALLSGALVRSIVLALDPDDDELVTANEAAVSVAIIVGLSGALLLLLYILLKVATTLLLCMSSYAHFRRTIPMRVNLLKVENARLARCLLTPVKMFVPSQLIRSVTSGVYVCKRCRRCMTGRYRPRYIPVALSHTHTRNMFH